MYGIIGRISVQGDWTTAYEIMNSNDSSTRLIAQRFNRISGGLQFQVRLSHRVIKCAC